LIKRNTALAPIEDDLPGDLHHIELGHSAPDGRVVIIVKRAVEEGIDV